LIHTAVNVGGVKKGSGHLENYHNIVIISADRNGSTAFQHNILGQNLNNDKLLWMGECFSQDAEKNQPPAWYNPNKFTPKETIKTVNIGTGKPVLIKIQITYPNFNKNFLEITAERKIFFHRNLFDSTLSRCIAQKTGKWWWNEESNKDKSVLIPEEFFLSRLEWRIDQYIHHIDAVLDWANEIYTYENYNYDQTLFLKPNKDKKEVVKNYNDLYKLYKEKNSIKEIEEKIFLEMSHEK
jgi:hypothetical protein